MKIDILLSLVAATVSGAGAGSNTERIDQLTGTWAAKPRPNVRWERRLLLQDGGRWYNHFTPSRLSSLIHILRLFPLVNGSDKLTNFLYLMLEDA